MNNQNDVLPRPSLLTLATLILLFLLLTACGLNGGTGGLASPEVTAAPTMAGLGQNPFGVMMPGVNPAKRFETAKALGAVYYRPLAVFLDRGPVCEDCQAAMDAGLQLALTVRASGDLFVPADPPADLESYKTRLRTVLERYKPAVVAIENEQDNLRLYYKGSAEQYLAELKAACEVAHAVNVRCADGGMTSLAISLLVTKDLFDTGHPEQAVDFARRSVNLLMPQANIQSAEDLQRALQSGPEGGTRPQAMISGFQAAGVDLINFHWYVPDQAALTQAIAYLRRAGGGLPVMSNEIGQRDNDAEHTRILAATARDLHIAPIIWYSNDAGGGARALTNPDGSLRPMGEAFKGVAMERK